MILTKQRTKFFLIGNGSLMIQACEILSKLNKEFCVILSERHSKEIYKNKTFLQFVKSKKYIFQVSKNINTDKKIKNLIQNNEHSIALCFGPSWIFEKKILDLFNHNMFNINCIPLPKYMGGAHFTWQILNQNRECGIFLQEITKKLDQGMILYSKKFKLKKKNLLPQDYFDLYESEGKKFIKELLFKLINEKKFLPKSFEKFYSQREYYPRQSTEINGMINWGWGIENLILFCNAFDKPYKGASTYFKKHKIYLKKVSIVKKTKFHPFTYGLILRESKNFKYIASNGGLIKCKCYYDNNKIIKKNFLKQGDRLYTPHNIIQKSLIYRPKYK